MKKKSFNDIRSNEEKVGGRIRCDSSFNDFNSFISANGLIDIGFLGHFWTWRCIREGEDCILERLDRALASQDWFDLFKNATVSHVDMASSDHCLLDIVCFGKVLSKRRKFFFDDRWINKPGFHNIVREGWNTSIRGTKLFQIMSKIKQVRMKLNNWK